MRHVMKSPSIHERKDLIFEICLKCDGLYFEIRNITIITPNFTTPAEYCILRVYQRALLQTKIITNRIS